MNKTSFSLLARVRACRFRARAELAPTIEVLVRSSGFFAPLVSRARAAGWKARGGIATLGARRFRSCVCAPAPPRQLILLVVAAPISA